jgi:hypothetical protein
MKMRDFKNIDDITREIQNYSWISYCTLDTYTRLERERIMHTTNGILLKISDQLERIADALEKGQDDEH